ncbi:uncharacterized protein KZ484_010499 isoform 1-T1 [Pholidichthys leucotaenia]
MAAGASARLGDLGPDQSPLVAVTFQRDTDRKKKYLEAEPKALGITQMGLGGFVISFTAMFLSHNLGQPEADVTIFVTSTLVIVAGILAVVAQNLHLPTLRACMGMQLVACGASIIGLIVSLGKMAHAYYPCWHDYDHNNTLPYGDMCHNMRKGMNLICAGGVLIQAALIAISATLVCYSCKVANCCCPAPKMPVITVQVPPAPAEESAQMNTEE